jgi:hypothetical protein
MGRREGLIGGRGGRGRKGGWVRERRSEGGRDGPRGLRRADRAAAAAYGEATLGRGAAASLTPLPLSRPTLSHAPASLTPLSLSRPCLSHAPPSLTPLPLSRPCLSHAPACLTPPLSAALGDAGHISLVASRRNKVRAVRRPYRRGAGSASCVTAARRSKRSLRYWSPPTHRRRR